MNNIFNIREITAEQTRPLRHEVLRPDQDFESTKFEHDDTDSTFHLGLFTEDVIIGIASFYQRDPDNNISKGVWRLRGMALDKNFRNMNLGLELIQHVQNKIKGDNYIWCNARTSALGFYEKAGFTKASEEFEIDGIGPHYVMKLDL